MVAGMLEINPSNRLSSAQAYQMLKPYEYQIYSLEPFDTTHVQWGQQAQGYQQDNRHTQQFLPNYINNYT